MNKLVKGSLSVLGLTLLTSVGLHGYMSLVSDLDSLKERYSESPSAIQNEGKLEPADTASPAGAGNPVVRIRDAKGHFCSAFIIAGNYALTAGHCVVDRSGFLRKEGLSIETMDHQIRFVRGVGVNLRMDIGLLKGDFTGLGRLRIYTGPGVEQADAVAACGYPQASRVFLCVQQRPPLVSSNFQYFSEGMIYPGMSGGALVAITPFGPVAIGINVAVNGTTSIFTSLIGLEGIFGTDFRTNKEAS